LVGEPSNPPVCEFVTSPLRHAAHRARLRFPTLDLSANKPTQEPAMNTSALHRYTDSSFSAGALDTLMALLRLLVPGKRFAPRAQACFVELKAGQSQAFEQPQHLHLVCLEGCVWITHDNSDDDYIVERGQHFIAASNSRMLVHAMAASRVRTWTPREG
jgi:hypothetical protein